ncbi:MAG: hypothetical protein ACLUEQ_06740 [Cloacibacillus evryensis]
MVAWGRTGDEQAAHRGGSFFTTGSRPTTCLNRERSSPVVIPSRDM